MTLHVWVSFALIVLASVWRIYAAGDSTCSRPPVAENNISCGFLANQSFCGWENAFNSQLSVTINWTRYDGYAQVVTPWDQDTGKKARLRSGLVCAVQVGSYYLEFAYTLDISNKCELSVYLVQNTDFTLVWLTKEKSEIPVKQSRRIPNTSQSFKLVIQVKTLKPAACTIRIRNIVFRYVSQGYTASIPMSWTALPTTAGLSKESGSGGLSGEAVAAIIICLLLLVAVMGVIVIAIVSRRGRDSGENNKETTTESDKRHGVNNSYCQSEDDHTSAAAAAAAAAAVSGAGAPRISNYYSMPHDDSPQRSHLAPPDLRPGHPPGYEPTGERESHVYSMPSDCDTLDAERQAEAEAEAEADNPYFDLEADGGYSTPDAIEAKDAGSSRLKGGHGGEASGVQRGDSYNKLSFEAHQDEDQDEDDPKKASSGPYNRLQEQDDAYATPRSDAGVYSLATNPDASRNPVPAASASATPRYAARGAGGGGGASAGKADYSRINLKESSSVGADLSGGQGQSGGVYSHLGGQGHHTSTSQADGDYNRVGFAGHPQTTRADNTDDPYNRLAEDHV